MYRLILFFLILETTIGWSQTNPTVHSVKSYGAIGNGIADDREAVQKAVNAATDGGVVYFPSGTYLMGRKPGLTLVQGLLLSATVVNPGSGYTVGTRIAFPGASIVNAAARVVSVNSAGGITAIQLVHNGRGYNVVPISHTVTYGRGTGATFTFVVDPRIQTFGFNPLQNYSVVISNKNISIVGDGDSSVIKQADAYTIPIFVNYPAAPNQGQFSASKLKFKGDGSANLIRKTGCSAGQGTGALLYIHGASDAFKAKDIIVENCTFEDGNKNYPLFLGHLERVKIIGNSFLFFKDFILSAYTTTGLGTDNEYQPWGLPAIFNGGPKVVDCTITGNLFNGDLANCPPFLCEGKMFYVGSDGLVDSQQGDDFIVSDNIIKNYKLEGVQLRAGKALIQNNIFETTKSFDATIAINVLGNTVIDPAPLYKTWTITGNQVDGGSMFIGNNDQDYNLNVYFNYVIANNIVTLGCLTNSSIKSLIGINIGKADLLTIKNNTIRNAQNFHITAQGTCSTNSFCEIENNTLISLRPGGSTDGGIGINTASTAGTNYFRYVKIKNNTISSGSGPHIYVGRPSVDFSPHCDIGDNRYFNRQNNFTTPIVLTTFGSGPGNNIRLGGKIVSVSLNRPLAEESRTLLKTDVPARVFKIEGVIRGAGSPSANVLFRHGSSRAASGTAITVAGGKPTAINNTSSGNLYNSFDPGTANIAKDSWLWVTVPSLAGAVIAGAVEEVQLNLHYD